MGEAKQAVLAGLKFNRSVRVEARGERLSDSGGAVLIRESLERMGALRKLAAAIDDPRDPKKTTHPQSELLTTFVTMLALGWQDQDDADVLRKDPLLRLAVSDRAGDAPLRDDPALAGCANPPVPQGLASQPTLSRLVHRLADRERLEMLRDGPRESAVRRVRGLTGGKRLKTLTLDIDALPIPVEGHQPGSAYNGHFHETVYHPLVTTAAELGDLLAVRLRRGQAHCAEGACQTVLDDVRWAKEHLAESVVARIDAGMPSDPLLSTLERERTHYLARLAGNAVLDRMAQPFLRRPPGRPPKLPRTWFHEMTYSAEKWSRERRVVLVVLEREDDLLLHHFWLVTSWQASKVPADKVLARYRRRGVAEGHLGEFKDVLGLKLSSSPRGPRSDDWRSQFIGPVRPCDDPFFRANDAMLQLCAIAYNAMHALRRLLYLGLPLAERGWSLRHLRERVLRVAARVCLHARRVMIVVTEATARYWKLICDQWRWLDACPAC